MNIWEFFSSRVDRVCTVRVGTPLKFALSDLKVPGGNIFRFYLNPSNVHFLACKTYLDRSEIKT